MKTLSTINTYYYLFLVEVKYTIFNIDTHVIHYLSMNYFMQKVKWGNHSVSPSSWAPYPWWGGI